MSKSNKILKRGAEAVIYIESLDGQRVLVKERVRKKYRLRQIDEKLRSTRTRQEMKLMREARGHGILTPRIVSSDEGSSKIVMEDVGGVTVRDHMEKSKGVKFFFDVGSQVGKMHSVGIMHGDLTTSNIILKGRKVYFVDFGLGQFSRRIEDMATDLNVMREVLQATQSRVYERCWKMFVAGYGKGNKASKDVLKRMGKIELRARYKR